MHQSLDHGQEIVPKIRSKQDSVLTYYESLMRCPLTRAALMVRSYTTTSQELIWYVHVLAANVLAQVLAQTIESAGGVIPTAND